MQVDSFTSKFVSFLSKSCFHLFRRKHKKGQIEELAKKKTRKTQKFQRAIVGASLTEILAKRNQKPEVRKAQRDQAIK
jgi:large subunit ribosomal protein L24e